MLVPAYVPVTTVPTTQPEDALGEYHLFYHCITCRVLFQISHVSVMCKFVKVIMLSCPTDPLVILISVVVGAVVITTVLLVLVIITVCICKRTSRSSKNSYSPHGMSQLTDSLSKVKLVYEKTVYCHRS